MSATPTTLKVNDHPIHLHHWAPGTSTCTAVIIVIHGMMEHGGQYTRFADTMTQSGVAIIAPDLPGAGQTAQNSTLGHLPYPDGWNHLLETVDATLQFSANTYPDTPLFILGHSMGAFLAQHYVSRYRPVLDGLLLSAPIYKGIIEASAGKLLANTMIKRGQATSPAKHLHQWIFGRYNQKIKGAITEYDWLSRDPEFVNHYISDPLCGQVCSWSFYFALFSGLSQVYRIPTLTQIRHDLPIYLFGGSCDPSNRKGKDIRHLYAIYRKLGYRNLTQRIYPGGRHVMLGELNKSEVISDLRDWIALVLN